MNSPRFCLRHAALAVCVVILALTSSASGQQSPAKRPLTHNDYDSWRLIQGQRISRDGKFLAYTLAPQDGDRELVVRNLGTGSEWRYGTGYVPPVTSDQSDEEPAGEAPQQQQGPSLFFTADSKSLVFTVLPTKADIEKARKEKKKPEEMPKNGMGIMSLVSGEVARIERVKNFRVPEEGSGYLVYQLEAKADAARPPKGVEYGTEVVLRSLTDQ